MNYINIGKIVNTHGLKGEVRIELNDILLLDFKTIKFLSYEELISRLFKINNRMYLGEYKDEEVIISYRHHKNYEMVTFNGLDNIDQVLKYKQKKCYMLDTNILDENTINLQTLIDFEIIYQEKNYGKIIDYQNNNGNIVIEILLKENYFIPVNNYFIERIDVINKKVYGKNLEELI